MEVWLNYFAGKDNTPAFIFDIDKLLHRALAIKDILTAHGKRNCNLCYAMKANPFLTAPLSEAVDKFEVCSPGELSICIDQKVDSKKVVFSGVNKGRKEIEAALDFGVGVFTVESERQLKLLRQCAREKSRTIPVILRVTSGNQFGMDWDFVKQIILRREKMPELNIKGIQYYSGTQKKPEKIVGEMEMLCGYVSQLRETGYRIEIFEYGPGLEINYFGAGKEDAAEMLLQGLSHALDQLPDDVQTVLEMGRFLVADCGWYLTKAVDMKRNGDQNYCLLDGGIHHVNYHGQVMGARKPPVRHLRIQDGSLLEVEPETGVEKWNLCGSLCTVADVLTRNLEIGRPQLDDYFLFERIGAYSVTEGIYLFLSRDLPKVYLWQDGKLKLVRDSHGTWKWNCGDCAKPEG